MGTLVVLVILGGLAVLVVTAWPTDPSGTSATLRGLTSEANLAGKPAGGAAALRTPVAPADAAACTANVRSVEQAAAAKHASDGAFPATVAELVAERWLATAPALAGHELTMEAIGGRPTGKILVNGRPAGEGCATPPRSGP